jgi:hypothetical protein
MNYRHLIVGLGLVLISASHSLGAPLRNFRVRAWYAGAYSDDSTGAFSHCAANASYKSGITVVFGITKNARWTVGFANPQWRLSKGATYDIAFTVDDMPPIAAKAYAISATHVSVVLQDSSELFARFRRGNVLLVAAADRVFSFNLTGTSQLLPVLLRCAMQNGNPAIVTNPFEKSRPLVEKARPITTRASDRSAERAEATTLAANLLSQAGIQGFVLLDKNELPTIKADAKWRAGNLFGTITVIPDLQPSQISDVPATLIAGDAKTCKGTFLSGAMQDEPKNSFARIFTTCNDGKDTTTVYYLAVPRKAGGAYIMTTATVGSEVPAKEADSNIRTAVYKVLPQN